MREAVLEGDSRPASGSPRWMGYRLFGLHRPMVTIAPAAAGHQTAGEFINDDDFAIPNNVMFARVCTCMRARSVAYTWCISEMLAAS